MKSTVQSTENPQNKRLHECESKIIQLENNNSKLTETVNRLESENKEFTETVKNLKRKIDEISSSLGKWTSTHTPEKIVSEGIEQKNRGFFPEDNTGSHIHKDDREKFRRTMNLYQKHLDNKFNGKNTQDEQSTTFFRSHGLTNSKAWIKEALNDLDSKDGKVPTFDSTAIDAGLAHILYVYFNVEDTRPLYRSLGAGDSTISSEELASIQHIIDAINGHSIAQDNAGSIQNTLQIM